MDKQNITLSLPKVLLREVKHLAVERGTSVSALLREYLEECLTPVTGYQAARELELRALREGFDLGTEGQRTWTRDSLHDR